MKIKTNPIAEVLGTSNVKEQLDMIQGLQMAAQAPVVDLVLRYDPRVGQIIFSVIGGNIPTDMARKILQAGLDQLHEQELKAALSANGQEDLSASKTPE